MDRPGSDTRDIEEGIILDVDEPGLAVGLDGCLSQFPVQQKAIKAVLKKHNDCEGAELRLPAGGLCGQTKRRGEECGFLRAGLQLRSLFEAALQAVVVPGSTIGSNSRKVHCWAADWSQSGLPTRIRSYVNPVRP